MPMDLFDIYKFVQDQGAQGKARYINNQMNALAGNLSQAQDPAAREQMIQQGMRLDRDQAMKVRDDANAQDASWNTKAANAARFVAQAYDSGAGNNVEAASRAYQVVRPFLEDSSKRLGIAPPPEQFDPAHIDNIRAIIAMSSGAGAPVQSTHEGADGYLYTVDKYGNWHRTDVLTPPKTSVHQTARGYENFNQRDNTVSPFTYGQPVSQPPNGMQPNIAPNGQQFNAPPDDPIAQMVGQADTTAGGTLGKVDLGRQHLSGITPASGIAQAPSKEQGLTPYQQQSLDIQRQNHTDATQAREAARNAQEEAKRQARFQREQAANDAADVLDQAIGKLRSMPGYSSLGGPVGDAASYLPWTPGYDARAQLDQITSQIVLRTMTELKALSTQGATGFGALSEKELSLLKDSMAALRPGISHAMLEDSLSTIQRLIRKAKQGRQAYADQRQATQQAGQQNHNGTQNGVYWDRQTQKFVPVTGDIPVTKTMTYDPATGRVY